VAPSFIYLARTRNGEKVKGTIISSDMRQAGERLRAQGYFVTGLQLKRHLFECVSLRAFSQRVSAKDLALFCHQLSTMLYAGLPLVRACTIIEGQHHNPHFRRVIGAVKRDLISGNELAETMAKQVRVFPGVLVHMVAAGEAVGALDQMLEWMAEHFEKEHGMGERVKAALAYPGVIALVAVVAVFFLVTFVLPTFSNLFSGSGLPLPWPTRMLLLFSNYVIRFWIPCLGGIPLVLIAVVRYCTTTQGKMLKDKTLLYLPFIGAILKKLSITRFCRTLGTLLQGGIPLLSALDIGKNAAGNQVIVKAIANIRGEIQRGQDMASLFEQSGIFSDMAVQLVRVGEETATLDRMLLRIAAHHDQEVDYSLTHLASLLEPIMVLLAAVVVGFIVISIMLPMLDLVTVIG
jgi:type IV pilus assembly protein PilC